MRDDGVFASGGEMGERMLRMDWSSTPLGPLESWPESLKRALGICLGSPVPIAIYWGPALAVLYNDAWRSVAGRKHPWALGRAGAEVWREAWDILGPLLQRVTTSGEPGCLADTCLPIDRNHHTEECYFDVAFSPIRDEYGRIAGVFSAGIETTCKVIHERRTRVLRELGEQLSAARSPVEVGAIAAAALSTDIHDVSFCGVYLAHATDPTMRLVGVAGIATGGPAMPEHVKLDAGGTPVWPFEQVRATGRAEIVTKLTDRLGSSLPGGVWPEPTDSAVIAPLNAGTGLHGSGYLVAGVSPRRTADEDYRQFIEHAAAEMEHVIGALHASATTFPRDAPQAAGVAAPTECAAADTERARASERLRAALEASAIGTYVWDIRTDRVAHDEGVNRLFGFEPGEGDPLDAYTARIHEDDRERWLSGIAESVRAASDFEQVYRVRWADGSIHWLIDKGRMMRDEHGQATHMTGAVVDITEQRQLTETAQDASRVKDEFLAMLGHELRNPLAPIVTALELMKMRGEALTKERVIIERQVRHLNRLVDDLLDVSRITRGLIALKREPVRLAQVIGKAVELAAPLLEEKRHHVSIDVPAELGVVADPDRLAQVFANLLTNAARYTPAGGHIAVTAALDGDHAIVHVRDDGIGIARDMVDRIFELFVQGDRGPERSEGGLGIGLALVKSLVRLHGGEVFATSAGLGTGSEFTVSLPQGTTVATTAPRAPATTEPRSRRRVLVVDDNTDASELLSDIIRELGHEVAVAHDGPEALAMLDRFDPEVAVLDIGLPVMDGYELAEQIRDRGHRACRLIALTGYGQPQDRARSRAAGFDAHLVKPVDIGELAHIMT